MWIVRFIPQILNKQKKDIAILIIEPIQQSLIFFKFRNIKF